MIHHVTDYSHSCFLPETLNVADVESAVPDIYQG